MKNLFSDLMFDGLEKPPCHMKCIGSRAVMIV